jgi:hypothetical protein
MEYTPKQAIDNILSERPFYNALFVGSKTEGKRRLSEHESADRGTHLLQPVNAIVE